MQKPVLNRHDIRSMLHIRRPGIFDRMIKTYMVFAWVCESS